MSNKRLGWYAIVLHAVLVIFCLLILLLARENRRLEERLVRAALAAVGGPEIDDLLPEVPVTELDGIEAVLAFDGQARETVLLVFTTTCPACQKNLEPWRDLHRRFGDRYRFVAVGLDPPEETRRFAEQHDLPYRVVVPADRSAFQRAYGIESVPQTLVVGADGRVKDVQPGVLPQSYRDRLG
jgi:peroxiredoxin